MARIRTLKPEFFTSEDIVALTPLARLLFQALWCQADREGRLEWKPNTFKLRFLPGDDCDIDELCNSLIGGGLVVLYGDGLAHIPTFKKHQNINPREAASVLPDPDACPTRADASTTRQHLAGVEGKGREGKGKERIKKEASLPKKKPRVGKPTSEGQVLERCKEIGLSEQEGKKFWNHYQANGWKVGKSPMASWHHALNGWKLRAGQYTNGNGKPPEPERDTRSFADRVSSYPNRTKGLPT